MDRTYWHKQTPGKTLFPQLEWSRPENRLAAGKLLVVGGHLHSFAAPAEAYTEAERAGVGSVRALLPASLRRTVGKAFVAGEFGASTPSGSFSQQALGELLEQAHWADGVLFAGDLGRNAETAILLEKFLGKSPVAITLTKDAIDYATSTPTSILHRENTLLVLSLSQLQRLGTAATFPVPVTFDMDLLHLVDWLHEFTIRFAPHVIVKHLETIFTAANGQVSTTKLERDPPIWRLKIATHASVWWLQNPSKPFEALTTAVATT
jgi:ADP-dependent NAD(P)H-hydrate dehydratase / NAD(P)H-hydrate epimerase